MKKLKYLFGFMLLTVAISCTDFVEPAIPYSGFETGLFLRTITAPAPINYFALSTETSTMVLEAVDADNGKSVEEVTVFVARRRGATVSTEAQLMVVDGSSFVPTTESKYTRATITFDVSDALTAMGFTEADMAGGDFIEIRLAAKDNKNRVFTNSNLSGDVSGGAFYAAPFFYRVGLVCPSDLAGAYSGHTDWVDYYGTPGSNDYTVNLSSVSGFTTRYNLADLSGGMEPIVWSGAPVAAVISDVCGQITLNSAPYAYAYYIDGAGNTLQPAGAKSNVNVSTGVITIYWINAYDEHGVTTLTPQ